MLKRIVWKPWSVRPWLELLERRLDLYHRFREVQGEIGRTGEATLENGFEATRISLDARFVFDPAVYESLEAFQKCVWSLRATERRADAAHSQDERDRAIDAETVAFSNFDEIGKAADQRLVDHMAIRGLFEITERTHA
jgi:hypothetical protein